MIENKDIANIMLETIPHPVFFINMENELLLCNLAFEQLFKKQKNKIINKKINKILPEEIALFFVSSKQTLQKETLETKLTIDNGTIQNFLCIKTQYKNQKGKSTGITGTIIDISERKKSEEKIIKQYDFLNTIIESIPTPFIVINVKDYSIITANKYAINSENDIGKPCYMVCHGINLPCDKAGETCPVKEVIKTKKPVTTEHVYYNQDGNNEIVEVHGYPIFDENGNVIQMIEYTLNITERKKNEEDLLKLRTAVEQSQAIIVITDDEGLIEYTNPSFEKVTGYSAEEAYGKNPRILKSEEHNIEFYKNLWDTIKSGEKWNGEFHNIKKDGTSYWESALISPVTNTDGIITNFIAIKEDITEKKKLENELKHKEKRLREKNLLIEKDLEIAQLVQKDLIYRKAPEHPHLLIDYRYMPLEKVGGDCYVFMEGENNSLGTFLCDVSGHGIASALFISLIKSAADRVFKEYGNHPDKFMEYVNRELFDYMTSYFITGIFGLMKFNEIKNEVEFTFTVGGHLLPIIIKKSGEIFFTGTVETIIGIVKNQKYSTNKISLQKGDRIYLYTDGIPEITNSKGEIIGFDDDLLTFFKSNNKGTIKESLDSIKQSIKKFRGNAKKKDDITLIGFEIK